jgi:lysophospholipase L1-like esterase
VVRGLALAILALIAGAAPAQGDGLRTTPVVPPLAGNTGDNARAIFAAGEALGSRADVFAKVGDSITESGSFLQDLACSEPAWGRWSALEDTVEYYGFHAFPRGYTSVWCDRANSFSRASATAVTGWDAADALTAPMNDPPAGCAGLTPLACEYRLLNPSVALIMYGTNDVESFSPDTYEANLAAIVERSIEAGVIPVLSTIPPRGDRKHRNGRVASFNRRVLAVADDYRVPLWNYWRSLEGTRMVNHGLGDDGVHPNLYGGCEPPLGCRPLDFTRRGLRYGYNQRNLGALRVLDRLRAVLGGAVSGDIAPETASRRRR